MLRALFLCIGLVFAFSVALFPTFRAKGDTDGEDVSALEVWKSPGGAMGRLIKLWYGNFELDDLLESAFPALSVLLVTTYTLLLAMGAVSVILGGISGSYSELISAERHRWSLLRAAYTLQAEYSVVGRALKHSQLAPGLRGHGAQYVCLPTDRPASYLDPPSSSLSNSGKASALRRVRAYFLTLASQRAAYSLSPSEAESTATDDVADDVDNALVIEQLARMNEALLSNVRKRDEAQRRTQESLQQLLLERNGMASTHFLVPRRSNAEETFDSVMRHHDSQSNERLARDDRLASQCASMSLPSASVLPRPDTQSQESWSM